MKQNIERSFDGLRELRSLYAKLRIMRLNADAVPLLARWTKAYSISLILEGVVIATLLLGGLFLIPWTVPNDQGSINNAVLKGEKSWIDLNKVGCSSCIAGPSTVSIGPQSEAQYIVEFQNNLSPGTLVFLNYSAKRDVYVFGPYLLESPSSTFSSLSLQYVVFTYSFQSGTVGGPQPRYSAVWFTGPQGNLSQSVHTSKYGGTDFFHGGLFGTSIIDVDTAGNYTLHYFNPLPDVSLNGSVVMGPSSVIFNKPYAYVGTIAILVAGALSIATGLVLRKTLRHRPQTPES